MNPGYRGSVRWQHLLVPGMSVLFRWCLISLDYQGSVRWQQFLYITSDRPRRTPSLSSSIRQHIKMTGFIQQQTDGRVAEQTTTVFCVDTLQFNCVPGGGATSSWSLLHRGCMNVRIINLTKHILYILIRCKENIREGRGKMAARPNWALTVTAYINAVKTTVVLGIVIYLAKLASGKTDPAPTKLQH